MGLLGDILGTQSFRGKHREMSELIKTYLDKNKIAYTCDAEDNIFATKGETDLYAAYICHMDTNQPIISGFQVARTPKNHVWFAFRKTGDAYYERMGIGGDDKCGIYLCLMLLTKLPTVKVAFYATENSQAKLDLTFFQDCRWVLGTSRQGNTDLITVANSVELCSQFFSEELSRIGRQFGYHLEKGGGCNVSSLKNKGLEISGANISAGCWSPRTKYDSIIEKDLFRAFKFLKQVYNELNDRYPHSVKKPDAGATGNECEIEDCASPLFSDEDRICTPCLTRMKFRVKCKKCTQCLITRNEILRGTCYFCHLSLKD